MARRLIRYDAIRIFGWPPLYEACFVEGEGEDSYCDGMEVVTRYEREAVVLELFYHGLPRSTNGKGVLAELDETTRFHGDGSRFRGHATLDWGHWFREVERGFVKHIETMED